MTYILSKGECTCTAWPELGSWGEDEAAVNAEDEQKDGAVENFFV